MDKKILKNYVYDMLREVVIVLLPLIAVPYVSRVMTAEDLGLYSYSMNIVTYFTLTAELGFQYLGRKEIAKIKKKEERENIFLKIFLIRLVFGFLVNLFYFLFVPNFMGKPSIYILQGINLIAVVFDISWYYVGIEDFKRITVRSIFYKLINLILLFICVRGENVLLKYIVCMGLPNVFGNFLMFYKLGIRWRIPKLTIIEIKDYMISAILLLIPTLLKSLYTIIDKTMLGWISKMEEVGYYYQTFKIINVLVSVVYSIGTVSFSRLVISYHEGDFNNVKRLMKEIVTFVIHIGVPVIGGIICISDVFVPWFFGEQYLILNELLPLSTPLIVIIALNNIFCSQYLMATNKENLLIKYVLIGVILNLFFDAVFIPYFGAGGAIVASLISEFVVMLLSIIYYKKTMNAVVFEMENSKCFISTFIMLLILMIVKKVIKGTLLMQILIITCVGIVVYFVMEFLLRDSWVVMLFKKVRNRLES